MALRNFLKMLVALGVSLVLGFLCVVKVTVYDASDLIGASREKKLSEWEEFCEESGPVGATYPSVVAALEELEVPPVHLSRANPNGTSYSVSSSGETAWMKIGDSNVRNWDPTGDTQINVSVHFVDDRVSACHASVYSHGR